MFASSELQGDDEKVLLVTPVEKVIGETFVAARHDAKPLSAYSGPMPADLARASAIQEVAIRLRSGQPVGWKVGRAASPAGDAGRASFGWRGLRRQSVGRRRGSGAAADHRGGFAAIEAESVARIGPDVDPNRTE